MRRFEAVIQSEDSPGTGSLWLKNKKLWFFEGGWKPIQGAFDIDENKNIVEIEKLLIGNKSFLGENKIDATSIVEYFIDAIKSQAPIPSSGTATVDKGLVGVLEEKITRESLFPSLWDKILFQLDNTIKAKASNSKMLRHIGDMIADHQGTYIPVYITGAEENSIPAIYYNAHLYAMLDGKLKLYNIDTNESNRGTISELKTIDLTLLPTYIDLELGNTAEVKSYNLEQLQKVTGTQFFVHADYGIGVGSFNSGHGGETTIQTAGGDRVHYLITAEGECRKQEDRFEHSELFYNLGQIDVATLPRTITLRNSVDMQRFRKATSLAFEASSNGSFIDDVSMNQVSVNSVTNQRLYTSPDIIYTADQDWNYVKATATTFNDRIEIYLETL